MVNCLRLQVHKVLRRNTQTVQEQNYLSVEETLTESACSDHIKGKILSFKLDLALSELNLNRLLHFLFLHEHTFRSCNSDLECACLSVS